jgi:tripeptide aminopeptidase
VFDDAIATARELKARGVPIAIATGSKRERLDATLRAAGLDDVALDDNGYVTATLEPTVEGDPPTIGLIAHMDTSPDAPGAGVEPIVHEAYDGGTLELPRGGTVLDPAAMPVLAGKVGHDIVTSSGDTLLGADDKAGVAEIMTAVAHLVAHPELPRPDLRIAFGEPAERLIALAAREDASLIVVSRPARQPLKAALLGYVHL